MRNTSKPRDPYLLGSLSKGLEVIDCFARQSSWSLAELATALQQSKPTLFRILHTLEEFGYLHKDPNTARYALGLRFHTLGAAAVRYQQLRWQSLPPLQALAAETGETVHVGILYEGQAVCVQAVDGTNAVRTESFLGKHSPLHASAMGKMLLACLPDRELATLLAGLPLRRLTPKTITDPVRLQDALRHAREQGWVLDDEEMAPGLRCISAPIRDQNGRACASLAISAPAARLDPRCIEQLVPRVTAAAQRITSMLGGPTAYQTAANAA